LTLRPGIRTTAAISFSLRPKSPVLSFVLVSAVRTTVVLADPDVTTKVSPDRDVIIPLTPVAPAADDDSHTNRHVAVRRPSVAP
jgi:hypothetical protein